MGLTLALTTYNRDTLTVNAFTRVLEDPRIDEIVIVDDSSTEVYFRSLERLVYGLDKVKLFQNEKNLGCYHNKRRSVELSSNDWVILFDSDNILKSDYLDALFNSPLFPGWDFSPNYLIAPSFAKPHFDYTGFSGKFIDQENVKHYINQKNFDCLINTCNYVVNRVEYLRVWEDIEEPWTADTLFMNYNWLKAGNSIYVVPGMQYDHLVHSDSHYKLNVHKTGNFFNEIMEKLKEL